MIALSDTALAKSIDESIRFVEQSREFVEIKADASIAIDLRYASTRNFVGRNLYGKFNKAYLHHEAATKLRLAAQNLARRHSRYRLLIFDALRPRSVQSVLFDHVAGTPQEPYVSNPRQGSVHNYGFAVDLTLIDEKGRELDMGTPFDDFTELSQPRLEERFLREGRLSAEQIKNRRLLRDVMNKAGFTQLPIEWWHFDARPSQEVRANYRLVE